MEEEINLKITKKKIKCLNLSIDLILDINSFSNPVVIDVDASGPLEFFNLTCFSIVILFCTLVCFFNKCKQKRSVYTKTMIRKTIVFDRLFPINFFEWCRIF